MVDYSDFAFSMTRGDTRTYRFIVKDRLTLAVVDITNWLKFWFTAKIHLYDADAQAVMQLTMAGGTITMINPTVGEGQINVAPTHTASLDFRKYLLTADLQGQDPNSNIWTLARGTLEIIADPTRSST